MKQKDYFLLALCLIIAQLAGLIGSVFNFTSLGPWYDALEKSPLNPPNWVFGPVWTFLFLLMGISLFLIIRNGHKKFIGHSRYLYPALIAFAIQWLLNTGWSFLFFYLRSPFSAFIEIIALTIAIMVTIFYFYKIKKAAGYLLLPYLAWVIFASYLNLSFWLLNS